MRHVSARIPSAKQQTDYTCGPASLRAALMHFGIRPPTEAALSATMRTDPDFGTAAKDMVAAARSFGLRARKHVGLSVPDLKRFLAAGSVVILDFQAWRDTSERNIPWSNLWTDGHYAVLLCVDPKSISVMDPWKGRALRIPLREFLERWHTAPATQTKAGRITRRPERHSAIILSE